VPLNASVLRLQQCVRMVTVHPLASALQLPQFVGVRLLTYVLMDYVELRQAIVLLRRFVPLDICFVQMDQVVLETFRLVLLSTLNHAHRDYSAVPQDNVLLLSLIAQLL
jgi:hypothetical protein